MRVLASLPRSLPRSHQGGGRRRRGTTLVEAVTAILVLGIAIPPLIGLFTEVARGSVDMDRQRAALNYAEDLLEEIVSKAFEDPDGASGSFGAEEGARSAFDDVDDFDGHTESPPTTLGGALLDDYGGVTRSVSVHNVTATDPDPASPEADGSTDLKRIRVQVTWSDGLGGELTLTTLRTRI